MMTLSEIQAQIEELLPYWRDGKIVSDYVLEEIILRGLSVFIGDYCLDEVLPQDVVSMLLQRAKVMQENGQHYFVISNGEYHDLSYLQPLYATLMAQWCDRGWVQKADGGNFVLVDAS